MVDDRLRAAARPDQIVGRQNLAIND